MVIKYLFWQVGIGDRIRLQSKFWWHNVGSVLSSIEIIANLKPKVNKDWNNQLAKATYNNAKYKHILSTPTFWFRAQDWVA